MSKIPEYTIIKGGAEVLREEDYQQHLVEMGWTPPPKEQEPEFKPGDYIEFLRHKLNQEKLRCLEYQVNGNEWKRRAYAVYNRSIAELPKRIHKWFEEE